MRPTFAIFDLDGTLIDSAGDLRHAVNKMLQEYGCEPLPLDDVRRMIGEGAHLLISRALAARQCTGVDVETALNQFLQHYESDPTAATNVYPKVRETLDTLKARGIRLAVCTNKPLRLSQIVLERLGLQHYFVSVVGGDSFPFRKPDPRMLTGMLHDIGASAEESVLIGDSEVDAATAVAAKVPFVLMTYGYRRGPVKDIKAIAALDHFADLTGLIGTARA